MRDEGKPVSLIRTCQVESCLEKFRMRDFEVDAIRSAATVPALARARLSEAD
jgi:hypothetical protein